MMNIYEESNINFWICCGLIYVEGWLTLSKAFEKSIIKQSVCLPASMFRVMSSTNSINWVSRDRPFRNPCCSGQRILCVSTCFIVWLVMHEIRVSEIGLQLMASFFFPFLNNGQMFAVFHMAGIVPDSYDILNMTKCKYWCYEWCKFFQDSWCYSM